MSVGGGPGVHGRFGIAAGGRTGSSALPVVGQVRDFAKATGRLAKTDTLDAQMLAHFAEAVRPEVRALPDSDTQELHSLTARRTRVVEMLVAEKNRLSRASRTVAPRIRAGGGCCAVVRCGWSRTTCCALFPALARNSPWRCVNSGLDGSGPHKPGQRTHAGQERRLRRTCPGAGRALCGFPGGDTAQLGDPLLLPRLLAVGKPKKLALTACMRKLLTILNSMVKTGQCWNSHSINP